jgi:SsrA-binding protein
MLYTGMAKARSKPTGAGASGPAKKASTAASPTQLICQNRKAKHQYAFSEQMEAGIVLQGTEVKACRAGEAHLQEAYVQVMRNEAMLIGGFIGEYTHGNQFNHPPARSRKLLLHRAQIDKLEVALAQKGSSAVPLSMYFKDGRVKLNIGIGRGKSHVDKRSDIKERETQRDMERALRGRTRGAHLRK